NREAPGILFRNTPIRVQLSILKASTVPRVPNDEVSNPAKVFRKRRSCLLYRYQRDEILGPEHLIDKCPHSMHILIADLNKQRSRIGEHVPCDGQPVAKIREIAV